MNLSNQFDPNFEAFFPDILNESFEDCVMVPLPADPALVEYISSIPDDVLYTAEDGYGREDTPHVTVLYGISDTDAEKTKDILKKLPKQLTATLGKITLFETNPKFDVLKIDVTSPSLARLNDFLCKNVEYHNDYPKYHPHVTLAYLKKGRGKPYVGDTTFDGKTVKFDSFIYSDAKSQHTIIKESSIMTGMGGGYGGQAGGPLAGSWGSTFSSPTISGPRQTTRKTQPTPSGGPGGRGSYMQGNTVINNSPYDSLTPEDLTDPRFSSEEIRQGIRYEMTHMEYPDKDIARRIVLQHLEKNPKYYSDLHMYLDVGN